MKVNGCDRSCHTSLWSWHVNSNDLAVGRQRQLGGHYFSSHRGSCNLESLPTRCCHGGLCTRNPEKQTHKNISTNTALSVWSPRHHTDQRPLNAIISQKQQMVIKALFFFFLSQSAYVSKCTTIFYILHIHLQSAQILKGLSCIESNAGVLHFEINRFKSINTHFIITVNLSSLASTIISLTNKLLFMERNQQNCSIRPKYIYQWQRSYIIVIKVNKEHLD